MKKVKAVPVFRLQRVWRSTASAVEGSSGVISEYDKAKPFDEIPGPKGLPYIGTMLKYRRGPFGKYNINRYQESLLDLYQRYGKICKETIAGTTIVHLFDPDYIRTVYQTDGKFPHVAPLMETKQLYRKQKGFSPGLGNTNGEERYKLRSAVQQLMMRPKAVTVYLPFVTEVADDFIKRLKEIRDENGHVENLSNEVSKWNVKCKNIRIIQFLKSSANCIKPLHAEEIAAAMTVFEKRLHCISGDLDSEVQKMINANLEMFTLSAKTRFKLPLYKMFQTPTWKKLCMTEECVYQTSERYLNEALSRISNLARNNELEEGQYSFLTYLLGRPELDRNDVSILALSLFVDGLSTTSPTLASNIYCLGRYQDAQEKVYQEIQRVVSPGSQITAEMINRMSYLKAFVKEVFRFFPANIDVPRIPQQNLTIGGYQIPAGTRLELNNYVMFKDPQFFDESEDFKAERWLRDGSAKDIHPYIHIPFSHGPRMCVGRRFAEQEMYVVIIKLLQNFRLEWTHKDLGQKYKRLMVPDAPIDVTFHNRT